MTLPVAILISAAFLYLTAFVFHLAAFWGFSERINRWAFMFMRVGFLIHTFFFFSETKAEGLMIPVSTFGQVMAFFSWALAFVYLVLLARIQSESFGIILAPLLALFLGIGLLNFEAERVILPSPMNPYFILHLGSAFFAYASFTLSFAAAVLYLIQHYELKRKKGGPFYQRLPSLEALEGLIYQPMAWGVFLLFLTINVGFLWSKSAFGTYWLWEPKTLITLGIAVFYLVLVFVHYGSISRGKRMVVASLMGFVFIFLSFFGTHLFGKGLHQLWQ